MNQSNSVGMSGNDKAGIAATKVRPKQSLSPRCLCACLPACLHGMSCLSSGFCCFALRSPFLLYQVLFLTLLFCVFFYSTPMVASIGDPRFFAVRLFLSSCLSPDCYGCLSPGCYKYMLLCLFRLSWTLGWINEEKRVFMLSMKEKYSMSHGLF